MTKPRTSERNNKRKDYKAMNLGSDSENHSSDSDYETSKSKRQKSTEVHHGGQQSSSSSSSGDEDEEKNDAELLATEASDPDENSVEVPPITVISTAHQHASTKEKTLIWPHFAVKKMPTTGLSEEGRGQTMFSSVLLPKPPHFKPQIRDAKRQHPI
jgi:hypothetical protein